MKDDPRLGNNYAEKGYKYTHLKKKQSETAYRQEAIVLNEEPIPINGDKLKELHHRSVGAITFLNNNRQLKAGSAVIISRDTILTAAHNIFDKKENCEHQDFKFYIGKDGVATTQAYQQIEAWKYPEQFKTCKRKESLPFDYAIMKLRKPINFEKYLLLCSACPKCLLKDNEVIKLSICGFPCAYPPGPPYFGIPFNNNFKSLDQDDEQGKIFILNQYGLTRKNRIKVVDVLQHKIGYGISTLPGQSGSPVVVYNTIIAVHVGGEINKDYNVGRIVDQSFINNITKWGKQLNIAPFSLEGEIMCQHNKQKDLSQKNEEKLNVIKPQPIKVQEKIVPVVDLKKQGSDKNKQKQLPIKTNLKTELLLRKLQLKNVDLRQYGNLMVLDLRENYLQQIDLAHCPCLTRLNLNGNQLLRIDLANHKQLTQLYLHNNLLQEIDLRANVYLTSLGLSNNKLQEIDVRANINLTQLGLWSNQLKQIDVRANINLAQLDLSYNKLREIDVRTNINLTHLNLESNRIEEIDMIENTKLKWLQLQKNKLASVRLWIAEQVQEKDYIIYFQLSDQQSAACRVQLMCLEQTKQKAVRIAESWKEKCRKRENNKYKCRYKFEVV